VDSRADALTRFAGKSVDTRGRVNDGDIESVRGALETYVEEIAVEQSLAPTSPWLKGDTHV
jgi:hypothetical protein